MTAKLYLKKTAANTYSLLCCLLLMLGLWTTNVNATTCASAITLSPASLPITNQSLVCGATNDMTSSTVASSALTGGCSSTSYYGGLESLYKITPTTSGTYTISYSGQIWTQIVVFNNCPTTAGTTCVGGIASSASSKSINVALTSGITYYIMFDTWPTPNSPCAGTFSISAPAAAFNPCTSITTYSTCGTSTVASFGSSAGAYNPPATSCGFTTPGEEKIYSFTPTTTGNYQISQTASSVGYIDYFYKVASGGCSGTGWTCIDDITGANIGNALVNIALTAGTQYYFLLDPENAGAQTATFSITCPAAGCAATALTTDVPVTTSTYPSNYSVTDASTIWSTVTALAPQGTNHDLTTYAGCAQTGGTSGSSTINSGSTVDFVTYGYALSGTYYPSAETAGGGTSVIESQGALAELVLGTPTTSATINTTEAIDIFETPNLAASTSYNLKLNVTSGNCNLGVALVYQGLTGTAISNRAGAAALSDANGAGLSESICNFNTGTNSGYYIIIIFNNQSPLPTVASNYTVVMELAANTMTSANSATVCSGSPVSISLTSSMAGSTFTWIAADNANTTGESTTLQSTSTLSNTITNNTASAQNVVYTVTPISGLTGCSGTAQTVTVTVNKAPVIGACPANITQCNPVATWTNPSATGAPTPTVSCTPASGSTFAVGNTTVNCTATNTCGSSSCSFNVHINSAPVIGACPANITQCNPVATWTNPSATGDPTPTISCTPASGSTFAVGNTTVTCTATNSCGSSSCSFNVHINSAPVIGACPANITQCNPVATWTNPSATGDPTPTLSCTPASGSTFAVGNTTVTCTATNSCGSSSCSFNVHINSAPVIGACPSDITQCNPVPTWTDPTATGDPAPTVACSPASGSTFAAGNTTVTCTATNTCGSSSCSFNVHINSAPVIGACPSDITQCNPVATWTDPTATGDPAATVACSPASGSTFAAGNTTVTCTATNTCGSSSCSFNVHINSAPVIGACPSDITQCNPVATWTDPTATGDPAPTVACSPASGSTFSVGTTSVTCTATNSCGSSSCSFNVTINTPSTAATSATSSALYGQVCSPGTVTLTANGGSLGTGASWVWYDGGCASGAAVGSGSPLTIAPAVGAHNYYVRAEGACGNTLCQNVAVTSITAPPSGTIHYTAGLTDGCVGAPAQTISVNAVANCTFYNWTSSEAGVRFNGNPSPYQTTTPTVNVTFVSLPVAGASGWSICVFGGNACGNTNNICTWARATVSTPTSITGSVVGCPGSTGNPYSSAAVAGSASYQWTGSAGITVVGNGAQAVTVDFSAGFVSGTLSVHGQNACGYNGADRTITISRAPGLPGAISGTSYPCPSGSSAFSVAVVPGAATYTWTTSVVGAIVTGTTNSCSIAFPASIPAGSTVSVTANSSCPFSSPVRSKGIASGMPNLPGNISGPAYGQCEQTGVSYSIGPVANATGYSWSSTCGTIVGPTNLSGINMDWAGNMTNCTISVVSSNACGSSTPRTLIVSGIPNTPTAITGNVSAVCANSVEQYCASGSTGATSYQWIVPAGAVILGPTNGACVLVQWGSNGGTLICKAVNGCGVSGSKTQAATMTCRQGQVNSTVEAINAEVYPNPATEKATVKFTAATAGQYHLNMTNVLGQNVLSADGAATEGINMIELNLSSVAKGVYMLNIMSGDNNEQIRVVVE